MKSASHIFCRILVVALCASLLAACASNGPPKPPDPGSKAWYNQRMQEIEASKAAGQLTDEQYISLKNEADATRAEHLNSTRYNNSAPAVGIGIGIGHYHHHH